MYNTCNDLRQTETTKCDASRDDLKKATIEKICDTLISDFPPYEIAEILSVVKKSTQEYFRGRVTAAKENYDRMVKESDSLFNM